MGRNRKGKAKSGTWFTRELLLSPAYVKLSSSGKTILGVLFLKRDMDNNHNCINALNLTATYKELEAMGISRGSVTNGITDLLSKGFVKVVRIGGAYQKDKTVYGLTEDWRFWKVNDRAVRVKAPGKKNGYFALEQHNRNEGREIISTTGSVPIHTTGSVP